MFPKALRIPPWKDLLATPNGRQDWLIITLDIAVGLLGNYVALPLFFGIDFIFGSILALMLLQFYGLPIGALSATIIGAYTWVLWRHPFAMVVVVLEVVFVGLRIKKNRHNLAFADTIYWLLIGLPLVVLIYLGILKMPWLAVVTVAFKQAINGIFNALVAGLLCYWLQGRGYFAQRQKSSLQGGLFNLFLAFVLVPLLCVTVVQGRQLFQRTEPDIQERLNGTGAIAAAELNNWHQRTANAAKFLRSRVRTDPTGALVVEPDALAYARAGTPHLMTLYILDRTGAVVAESHDPTARSPQASRPGSHIGQRIDPIDPIFDLARRTGTLQLSDLALEPRDRPNGPTPHVYCVAAIGQGANIQGWIYGEIDLPSVQQWLATLTLPDAIELSLMDRRGLTLASSDPSVPLYAPYDWRTTGKIKTLAPNRYQWMPPQDLPPMTAWRASRYLLEQPLDPYLTWKFIIKLSPTPYINRLQVTYLQNMGLMLILVALGAAAAHWLSRYPLPGLPPGGPEPRHRRRAPSPRARPTHRPHQPRRPGGTRPPRPQLPGHD